MEFWREIAGALGAGDAFAIHYAVVDGRGGYFQNVVRLVRFTEREIVLRGRRGELHVLGEGLSLGRYCAGDLVIRGNITGVGQRGEEG